MLITVSRFDIQTRAIRGHLARGRRRMRMEDKARDKLTVCIGGRSVSRASEDFQLDTVSAFLRMHLQCQIVERCLSICEGVK